MPAPLETSAGPFENFNPETSGKIIDLVEELCIDDIDASAHLAGVLVSLVPKVEIAVLLVEVADRISREVFEDERQNDDAT